MKRVFSSYLLIILFSFFSTSCFNQNSTVDIASPESVGLSSDSLSRMNAYFHGLVDEGQVAGIQTAVMRKGELVHFNTYGFSNIEEEKLLDEQSIFRIFSMTKPIVSAALMKLYEDGHFKLDDPLYKFLPDFEHMKVYHDSILVPAKNPIKIIDLLRHTSGFSYGRGANEYLNQLYTEANLYSSQTNKEYVQKLSKLPLQFEPGTDWQYSVSTNIIGYLIEVISGKSLDEYLQKEIFEPLDMNDTHFQLPKEKIDRFTVGYGWENENGLFISEPQRNNRYTNKVTLFNGGGGLVSTTFDYLKFCQMILNKGMVNGKPLLKEETISLMLSDHLSEVRKYQERLRLPYGEYGFGLGFAIRGRNSNDLEKVYGWGGAVGTYFKIDTENDLIYILMIQLSPYRQLGLRQLFQEFVESSLID